VSWSLPSAWAPFLSMTIRVRLLGRSVSSGWQSTTQTGPATNSMTGWPGSASLWPAGLWVISWPRPVPVSLNVPVILDVVSR